MISEFPDLPSDTLALRAWSVTDVDALVRAGNDPDLLHELGLPTPYTAKDAYDYVALCAAGWDSGSQFTFAVTARATGLVVGSVRVGPSPHGATAGYWTAPWARRRGIASDALRMVTTWATSNALSPIRLYIAPSNIASQRVAANAGFRHDDHSEILDAEGMPGDLVFITP